MASFYPPRRVSPEPRPSSLSPEEMRGAVFDIQGYVNRWCDTDLVEVPSPGKVDYSTIGEILSQYNLNTEKRIKDVLHAGGSSSIYNRLKADIEWVKVNPNENSQVNTRCSGLRTYMEENNLMKVPVQSVANRVLQAMIPPAKQKDVCNFM